MKNLHYLLVALCLLTAVACDDDDGTSNPEIVSELYFGTFYGECFGNCATIYWLRNEELRIDTISYYYGSELSLGDTGAYNLLSDSLYQLTANLRADFPVQLYDEDETIGLPDAYDQGGYFIAVPSGSGYRFWQIDTNFDDVPDELEPFLTRVSAVMTALRE